MDDNLVKIAISELIKADKKLVIPGQHKVSGDFTVRVDAFIQKSQDTESTPTTSIPFKTVLALLIEKAGATRNGLLSMLEGCIREAIENQQNIEENLSERFKDIDAAIGKITSSLKSLPKIKKSGATRVIGEVNITENK